MPPVSQVEVSSLSTEGGAGDGGGRGLSREDCLCPICLDILLEPVTLPCEHTFCKACFLESADKASMCCPLCRKRVATWSRLHSRNNTLVNTALWTRIQAAFPLQCQRRIRGQEDGGDEHYVCLSRPRVSEPGEVRREYEDQISKLAEEKRAVEDTERSASEEYIKALEEQRLAEERRRQEERERQLEDDERLAKLLSLELNTSPISESQINARTRSPDRTGSAAKKKHKTSGDIQKFFSPVRVSTSSSDSSPTSSLMANKENIIHSQGSTSLSRDPSECHPMPRLDYYGQEETDHSSTPSGPTAASLGTLEPALPYKHHQSADVGSVRSHSDRDGAMASSGKRKGSEMDLERCTKRPCSSPASSSSSLSSSLQLHELLQQQLEEELAQRTHQEEEDRKLALLLQKTMNEEEKHRATDRSKGSKNAYGLRESPNEDRPKRRIENSPGASVTSGNVSRTKTGVTAGTNGSTGQSEKPKKQTTLKEMFDRRGKP